MQLLKINKNDESISIVTFINYIYLDIINY